MPTISQLPAATSVSAADLVPVSQGGTSRSAAVGTLLESTQPAILVQSPALIGRISLGSGGPEQVGIGTGVTLSAGTLVADGLDHAGFPALTSLLEDADLVISNQGTPMLMATSLLCGVFTAGENVTITSDGTISASAGTAVATAEPVSSLPVVTTLNSQDLVAVSQAGADRAISYTNFLGGVTIDEAQPAAAASDSDTIWAAQGSNVMASQTFAAIWVWISTKLPTYKAPVLEITTNTNLDTTIHNGRILVCSQPVTLTPLVVNMGSGFCCTVVNASSGSLTLGTGFISSTGSLTIAPQQSASIYCLTYSGGTIAFAALAGAAATAVAVPGQVANLTSSAITPTSFAIAWQAPTSGATPGSYTVSFRQSGTASWTGTMTATGQTTTLNGLIAATSYDIMVQAINTAGAGLPSAILTVTTAVATQSTPPSQVTGLSVTPASSTAVQLSWTAQTGASAATSFTVQYRTTGSTTWTGSVAAISGSSAAVSGLQAATSYDFSVFGVNGSGAGIASSVVTATTQSGQPSVTSITWNILPNGSYTHSVGAIPVNAFVLPGTSPIQIGFSQSATTPPTSWVAANLVNNNLWGAYVPTPPTTGNWYVWAEGLDGSLPTVNATSFPVQ